MASQTIIISNGAVYNDYSDIPDMIQQLKAKNPGFSSLTSSISPALYADS